MLFLFSILLFASSRQDPTIVDGEKFDLQPMIKRGSDRYHESYNDWKIYWNILENVGIVGLEECRYMEYVAVGVQDGYCYGIALKNTQEMKLLDNKDGILFSYTTDDQTQFEGLKLKLVCDNETSQKVSMDDLEVVIEMHDPHGCSESKKKKKDDNPTDKPPKKKGISFGSVMLIIIAALIVLYFAIGIPIWKFGLKKTGIEIIPFVNFWRMVPGLVIGGVKFLLSPCLKSKDGYKDFEK